MNTNTATPPILAISRRYLYPAFITDVRPPSSVLLPPYICLALVPLILNPASDLTPHSLSQGPHLTVGLHSFIIRTERRGLRLDEYIALLTCRGIATDEVAKELVFQLQQFKDGAGYVGTVRYISKCVKMGIIMPTILILGTMVPLACMRRRQEMEINAMRLKTDPGERQQ